MKQKHSPHIRKLAEKHAASKGLKLNHEAVPLNEDRSKKIAQAFEELKHEPENPEVKQAYKALIDETISQYQLLKKSGLKVTPITPDMKNPYKNSGDMIKDVRDNNHIYFYPTDLGFGGKDNKTSNHPLLQPTKEKAGEHKMVANDIFRVVHDYFGHAKEGVSFGPKGEEAAWQHHMQMYTPAAQKALTTETRGQNSWVNFGPQGEANRSNPENTQYAEQKAGILPDWAMETDQPEEKAVSNKDVAKHWHSNAYEGERYDKGQKEHFEDMLSDHHEGEWEKKIIPVQDIKEHHSGHDRTEDYVKEYVEKRKKGSEFPAIIAKPHPRKKNTYLTIDGMHRLKAAKDIGQPHIEAYVPKVKKLAEGGDIEQSIAEYEPTAKALTGQSQQVLAIDEVSPISQDHISAEPAVDPDLLRQVNRMAGSNHLQQLFASGLLKHQQPPAHEKAAVILSSGKAHIPRNSPLRKVSSNKLENNLGKFLEKLGTIPPATDEKSLDKIKLKAKQIVSLMPGMKGIGADETEHITNTILNAATQGELHDLQDVIDHETAHARNNKYLNKKIEGLFGEGYQHEESVSPKEHADLHKYTEDNGLADEIRAHSEQYAEGGAVKASTPNRVSELFPEHTALVNAHIAREHAYLNSVKPNKMKALPFDTEHKDVPADENYKQALSLAARPLSILDHVRNGTVSPRALKHFVSLNPELYGVLKQRLTDHIVQQQMEDKRPDFKTRQSMSIFVGAPLESTLTPQAIQAAQATFKLPQKPQNASQQPAQGSKGKKGTATLGKSIKQYRTPSQASESDRSNRD